jgi:septal ring factor EnvC (AmiA/AmiB activator)
MSIEQDLTLLKAKVEKLNTLRNENNARLTVLEEEKEKLLAEAQALGIAPDKVEEVLKTEEAAIQAEVSKLTAQLDSVLEQVSGI